MGSRNERNKKKMHDQDAGMCQLQEEIAAVWAKQMTNFEYNLQE